MSSRDQQIEDVQTITAELPPSNLSLEAAGDDPPVVVPNQFVIDDAQKASWVVRKIVEAREHAYRVVQWSEGELRRAGQEETWLLRRFGAELETWTKAELQREGGRKKSVNLPSGTIGFRRTTTRVEILDEPTVLEWCRDRLPLALKVTVEANDMQGLKLLRWHTQHAATSRLRQHVLLDPLNLHLAETGEVPDGAAMRAAVDQFYVR